MKKKAFIFVASVFICSAAAMESVAAETQPAESFKLGTFDIKGEIKLGLVLRDQYVVELEAANNYLQRRPMYVKIPMAEDMKELAGRYRLGLKERLYQITNFVIGEHLLEASNRPWYVHGVEEVETLAPILYPNKILNAAANYYGHAGESNPPEVQARIAEARRRDRGIPYLFIKSATNAVIADGEPIVVPRGRSKIDWECEIATVIGKPARFVTAADAKDHIFGFTILIDVSDRGGRGEAEPRFGSDWLVGKGQDTFAPMGPYIVPAEFIENVMDLHQTLTVSGQVMQDARSSDMIHNIYELIEYGSQRLTLEAGDVISAGSPRGAGFSRSARAEQIFLKPGDTVEAYIEKIGKQTHKVKAYEK